MSLKSQSKPSSYTIRRCKRHQMWSKLPPSRQERSAMLKMLPFTRAPKRQTSSRSERNSISCKIKSRNLPPSVKSDAAVAAANVFQALAWENPAGLKMLESLAHKMLAATRLRTGNG